MHRIKKWAMTKNSENCLRRNQIQYTRQLLDIRWKQLRSKIIIRDGSKCIFCRSANDLQVHHKQYHVFSSNGNWKAPWSYPSKLLITLCEKCHQQGHQLYKVPVFEIKK